MQKQKRAGITTTKTDTPSCICKRGGFLGALREGGSQLPVTYKHTSVRLKIALLQLDYKNARQQTPHNNGSNKKITKRKSREIKMKTLKRKTGKNLQATKISTRICFAQSNSQKRNCPKCNHKRRWKMFCSLQLFS